MNDREKTLFALGSLCGLAFGIVVMDAINHNERKRLLKKADKAKTEVTLTRTAVSEFVELMGQCREEEAYELWDEYAQFFGVIQHY
jgi:hypothetical protein